MSKKYYTKFFDINLPKINHRIENLSILETKMNMLCYKHSYAYLYEDIAKLCDNDKYIMIY